MTPSISPKLGGRSASVSFTCSQCGVHFVFYGSAGGPYLQGVIDALIEEHDGHDFVLIEDGTSTSVKE